MNASPSPRVSILIPNYNNGRQSSRSGDMDLIGNLLQSLWDTLHDEPTPFELLVNDDASSDDSIETLRAWAQKTWPDGRPFLTLVESPHEGFISRSNNRMYAMARGDVFVRLDGDIVCLTRHWVSKIVAVFDQGPPELGIVGPKQLSPDGRIHACGDWLLHPNGYTHIAAGLDRYAVSEPIVCDHNMGCFYCCKRALFEDIGGYDEKCLRGETEDFTLRARLKGWTCLATPEVEFIHYHGMRHQRPSLYDSAEGVKNDLAYFERKWGFDRIAPDLDIVRRHYADTPLISNARWLAQDESAVAASESARAEADAWQRYDQDAQARQQVDRYVGTTREVINQVALLHAKVASICEPKRIVQIGAGDGLVAHHLALQGVAVTGIERDAAQVAVARRQMQGFTYPQGKPTLRVQADRRRLPLADDEADLVLLFNVLEHHPNPVGLLREVARIGQPGTTVVVLTRRAGALEPEHPGPSHPYTWDQLRNQLTMGLHAQLLTQNPGEGADLVAVAALTQASCRTAQPGAGVVGEAAQPALQSTGEA